MGREVKRVSMDFDWPLDKGWWGYLLDHSFYVECQSCSKKSDPEGKCGICYGERYATVPTVVEPDWGMAYQMWETTSEGSPMSPPFKTPEELARWLADTNASSFGAKGATYDEWLGMIQSGHSAPTMIISAEHGIQSGVAAVANLEKDTSK